MLDDEIDKLPAGPIDRPVQDWTTAQVFSDTVRQGLLRIREIVSKPITDDMDLKEKRLIAEVGLGAGRLGVRVAEGELRHRDREDLIEVLKERIAKAQLPKGG